MSHQHLLPLVSTLASEVIPSLMKEHGLMGPVDDLNPSPLRLISQCTHPSVAKMSQMDMANYAAEFSDASFNLNAEGLLDYVEGLFERGLDIEVLYLDIIPLAIKHMHDLWEKDQVSFLDITRATWITKRLIISLSSTFVCPDEESISSGAYKYQALVGSAHGNHHTLGPMLVSQFLERKGWHVLAGIDHQEKEILQLVDKNWIDLFCLSVSSSNDVPELRALVTKVRARSKNPDIQCLVGGPLVSLEPKRVNELHADAICSNAREVHSIGLKLVRVHRKLRKLHLVTANELTHQNLTELADRRLVAATKGAVPDRVKTQSATFKTATASNQDHLSPYLRTEKSFLTNTAKRQHNTKH